VADFTLYEMMNNLIWLFPTIAAAFPNLMLLRERVLGLDKIAAYENSDRAVKVVNPISYFKEFEIHMENSMKVG
jgi:hypothetical protein